MMPLVPGNQPARLGSSATRYFRSEAQRISPGRLRILEERIKEHIHVGAVNDAIGPRQPAGEARVVGHEVFLGEVPRPAALQVASAGQEKRCGESARYQQTFDGLGA